VTRLTVQTTRGRSSLRHRDGFGVGPMVLERMHPHLRAGPSSEGLSSGMHSWVKVAQRSDDSSARSHIGCDLLSDCEDRPSFSSERAPSTAARCSATSSARSTSSSFSASFSKEQVPWLSALLELGPQTVLEIPWTFEGFQVALRESTRCIDRKGTLSQADLARLRYAPAPALTSIVL
jgi:hypothetical protein